MASDDGDSGAFLTGLDLDVVPIREKVKDERLAQVRKDHKKLMDIVGQFGNKVGGMIDSMSSSLAFFMFSAVLARLRSSSLNS